MDMFLSCHRCCSCVSAAGLVFWASMQVPTCCDGHVSVSISWKLGWVPSASEPIPAFSFFRVARLSVRIWDSAANSAALPNFRMASSLNWGWKRQDIARASSNTGNVAFVRVMVESEDVQICQLLICCKIVSTSVNSTVNSANKIRPHHCYWGNLYQDRNYDHSQQVCLNHLTIRSHEGKCSDRCKSRHLSWVWTSSSAKHLTGGANFLPQISTIRVCCWYSSLAVIYWLSYTCRPVCWGHSNEL